MSNRNRAYVPGYTNDVFISYSHNDNSPDEHPQGWVTAFTKRLESTLRTLVGADVRVWRDAERMSPGRVLDDELKEQVRSSAVFVAIVSPSYLKSPFCRDEREWFLEAAGDELQFDTASRGIRVVRMPPMEGDAQTRIFPDGLGLDLYLKGEFPEALSPISEEFHRRFQKLGHGIARLLHDMRRRCTPVYLAACHEDLRRHRQELIHELTAHGYRVLPSVAVSEDLIEIVEKELAAASLSVHFLDATEHSLTRRQAELAMNLEASILVWAFEQQLYKTGEGGGIFRELLNKATYLEPPRARPEQVKTEMLALLSAHAAANAPSPNGKKHVYIMCDIREPNDYRKARRIAELIAARDGFHVDLPETAPLDPAELRDDHQAKLRRCHAALLFWDQAHEDWFGSMTSELGSRKFLSNAVGLGDPDKTDDALHHTVLALAGDFKYEELDALLEPLRE